MRISVTDLDGYRYFKDSEQALDEFLNRLRRLEPPNRKMLAGKALHKILERASSGGVELNEEITVANCDGFNFRFAADCDLPLLPVVELKGEIEIETPSGPVTLVGVVDGIDGAIYDHKLTERFDAEKYADSYQWRAYLVMFGARRFTYNVFEGKEEHDEFVIWNFQAFTLYAYEGMREDVIGEVVELAGFIAKHLPEKLAA